LKPCRSSVALHRLRRVVAPISVALRRLRPSPSRYAFAHLRRAAPSSTISVALRRLRPSPSRCTVFAHLRRAAPSSPISVALRRLRRAVFVAQSPSRRLRRALSLTPSLSRNLCRAVFVAPSLSAFSSSLHLGRTFSVSRLRRVIIPVSLCGSLFRYALSFTLALHHIQWLLYRYTWKFGLW